MLITTSSSLLLLLLVPILDLLEAQMVYIQTSLTQAQMEKSAQAHLVLSNLNKEVEDLEDDDTSPTRMIGSWLTSHLHLNPKRRGGDQPRQPQQNFYCHNTDGPLARIWKASLNNPGEGTAKPKKDDDLIPVALNIPHENNNSELLARSYLMLMTRRLHDYG